MSFRILILGAKGMLGQALVRVFSSPSSPPLNVRGVGGVIKKTELLAWDREDCDITDRAAVLRKITDTLLVRSDQKCIGSSVIINAAAYNDVDGAEKDATLANKINGEAVGYLAEAVAKIGATFVHYSTDYVFDGTKKEGYREDDAPNPISAYGTSKFLGERAALSLRGAERRGNPMVYLIRTSRLFGAAGNGKKSFVDLMLENYLEARTPNGGLASKYIEVVDEEFSSPTYVEDLAQQTRAIIEQKKPSGIYHVTNSGVCTWYAFAQEIFKQANEIQWAPLHTMVPIVKPVSSSRLPRPAKRPAYSQLVNTKLSPMRTWHDVLRDYLVSR